MNCQKNILLAIYVCVLTLRLTAQQKEINFSALTTQDGLSSNTVNAILKDSHGMMWFATEDGLDRFDGARFTIYRHKSDDSSSLRANEILSLYEDKEGRLWVGTSGGSLSLYDRKTDAFIHFPSGPTPNYIHNNVIRSICSDHTGKIWVAHFDGVNILDPRSGRISNLPLKSDRAAGIFDKIGMCLYEDSYQNMWIGTTQGLFQYNFSSQTIRQYVHVPSDSSSLSGDAINVVTQDSSGNLWVGTDGGLSMLRHGSSRFVNFKHTSDAFSIIGNNAVSSLAVDGNKLWIGTQVGLSVLDTKTFSVLNVTRDPRNMHSLTANAVKYIYIDQQGIYWVGTSRGGVNKYDKNLNLFNYVRSNVFDPNGLHGSVATCFAESEDGKIFVGTNEGLSLFDPTTRLFRQFTLRSLRNRQSSQIGIVAMRLISRRKLLISTSADGLFIVDPVSGQYVQRTAGPGATDLNSNEIYCIAQLRNGNFMVGTNGEGINVLDKDYKVISRYTPHPSRPNDLLLPFNGYIRDIKEDRQGDIWIATHGGGLGVLHPAAGNFTNFNTNNSKLPNDKVQCLTEDSQGFIWTGTFGGGIARIEPISRMFTFFSEKEGLQNSNVYKIIEDQAGVIWVSSNQGISSINIATGQINNFTFHNGLQHNNFARNSGIRLRDGELIFGGLDGFNYFHPSYLIKNKNIPPVMLTGLRVSNQSITASGSGPISEHISVAREINLSYKQNFALDFVGLSYTSPEQNKYAYKLEGFEKDWNYVGNITSASYTNLDPGDYVFRVRASNNDGVWNNEGASVLVHVRPPVWRTTYAYVAYIGLLIAILVYIRHKGIQKIHRKFALEQKKNYEQQERLEAERKHELDSQKIKFLTNLSHEFRTPISLILGPVDSLIEKEKNIQSFRQLDMIKRNGRRLLNLVNQLLDFRKMEEHELKLQLTQGELVSFVKEVADSFKDLAERKKMQFIYSSELHKLNAFFDHDKLERVLFNVLSNAFKFTRPGGKIMLEIKNAKGAGDDLKAWVAIRISDTGIGIPGDKKEKIFSLFYQNDTDMSILNQGSGIGLTITKEFVKMQGGTIDLESEPGVGTAFNIILPFTLAPAEPDMQCIQAENSVVESMLTDPPPVSQEDDERKDDSEFPSILLVEDDDDFRYYLKEKLMLKHKVVEAVNGVDGWKKALSQHPQLIVSDISMPEMNGIDLCRKLKADKRTSHIPIILLTALTGEEEQLKGLRTGASDYITKPFHVEILVEKVKNLLVLNDTLKNTYTRQFKPIPAEVELQSADEELINAIRIYLDENLSNPQLSVKELSKHAGMSRSSLYTKLLEITGQTPVEYIRSVKLDKAAVLLQKSDMNVAQIAYSVGFSTPNYFAKSFKAKFGVLPSEYISKMRSDSKKDRAV